MAGHTKGPWKVTGELSDVGGHILWCRDIEPETPTYIGRVAHVQSCDHISGIPQDEAAANARLIAAAPDLLAALDNLVDFCEQVFVKPNECVDIIAARAAMRLAKHGASVAGAAPATTGGEVA